ncbi:MAG: non-reducing end alpha-L-arabinofuranosidase family hydrolase [Bacteroidota bacterium]
MNLKLLLALQNTRGLFRVNYRIISCFVALVSSCTNPAGNQETTPDQSFPEVNYRNWTVTEPVLEAGKPGNFDEISVKDPTIVYFNGKYHLFYTSKATYETRDRMPHLSRNGSGLGYVSASTLKELKNAQRHDMGSITGSVIVAPQVFYFEPQQLWYIVAHTLVGGGHDLMPIYLTNPDIEDIHGWSAPQELKTRKINNGFWIDFWVICNEEKAHLFYTDHEGSLFRFECPLEEFPQGFANKKEETVLTIRGETSTGRWRMHEASHIYYVKEHDCYLNLMESVYPHPTVKYYWDSRNRFLFGMVAEKLEGPWTRIEPGLNEFLGDPANLFMEDGSKAVYDQVSHPELIRSGYDQHLEIENFNLQLLFQAFDADTIGTKYDYNYLPWKLMIMENY